MLLTWLDKQGYARKIVNIYCNPLVYTMALVRKRTMSLIRFFRVPNLQNICLGYEISFCYKIITRNIKVLL